MFSVKNYEEKVMNEKRYFVSEKKGKPIEFTLSHDVVLIFNAPNKRFEVRCAESDDFSEFYDELIRKEPNIRKGYISKTTNSILLYSNTSYLASVNELLPLTPPSQQELTSKAFQPVFTPVPTPISIPSALQNTQQHIGTCTK